MPVQFVICFEISVIRALFEGNKTISDIEYANPKIELQILSSEYLTSLDKLIENRVRESTLSP